MGQTNLGIAPDSGGAINHQGNTMKFRAISLAAAGLLAVSCANAAQQTWRLTGQFSSSWGSGVAPASFGEIAQFDFVMDTEAMAIEGSFPSALVGFAINGVAVVTTGSSLQRTVQVNPPLTASVAADAPGGVGAISLLSQDWAHLMDSSEFVYDNVSEFMIGLAALLQDRDATRVVLGMSWSEAAMTPYFVDITPVLSLTYASGGGQSYVLMAANNITPGVPEPSAWALALLGGMGAVALARRRQPARQAEALTA